MKVCENGVIRDMTQEEIEELEKMQQESQVQEEITIEERVSVIEDVILNLL